MTEAPHLPRGAVPGPPVPRGVDPSKPGPARLYDYYPGGHNNFEVDRRAAEALRQSLPALSDAAWANRGFHQRAATWLADAPDVGLSTADLRDPDALLGHPAVRPMIDLSEPTGLLMTAVLHCGVATCRETTGSGRPSGQDRREVP